MLTGMILDENESTLMYWLSYRCKVGGCKLKNISTLGVNTSRYIIRHHNDSTTEYFQILM